MEQSRVVGHVVAVSGLRVTVELSPDAKSSFRATPDGVYRAVAINSFLTSDLGAGTYAIGLLTALEASESYDSTRDSEFSLELTKPRRIASLQLLGTVSKKSQSEWSFNAAITVLPTLDSPVESANPHILSSIFAYPPKRNKPQDWQNGDYDFPLELGHQTGNENMMVKASFNDLFTRPLAVVGNTGSGKSYTVASLIQGATKHSRFENASKKEAHVFILDINGEYANAFLDESTRSYERHPNKVYLNGQEFCLPAWLMNGNEVCHWLKASEATQEPVLKDWWAIAKANQGGTAHYDPLQVAVDKIDSALAWLDDPQGPHSNSFELYMSHVQQYACDIDWDTRTVDWTADSWARIKNDREVRDKLHKIRSKLRKRISDRQNEGIDFAKTADAPLYIPVNDFRDPILVDRSTDQEGNSRIDQYLLTLKLRLRTRLDDKRWQSFFSYEKQNIKSYRDWMQRVGIGRQSSSRVSIVDFSMLSAEVLPFACALFGRLLLDTREMLDPGERDQYPWVLVLEEAHNYARPTGNAEGLGQRLSRRAFERIAKEGRKFGFSLIVASQRPSEISQTIISQCANFISHRIQNPDDIEYFRRIIPKQAQRLLDQVTVLAAGEAIVFGSSVHIATRIQIKLPSREPSSTTAAPFVAWRATEAFPLEDVTKNWVIGNEEC